MVVLHEETHALQEETLRDKLLPCFSNYQI